jgi:uncharacterized protein (DUF1810 family)
MVLYFFLFLITSLYNWVVVDRFIFPQLSLHGYSYQAIFFGIKTLKEAINYLKDKILGERLIEISEAALDALVNRRIKLKSLMGSSTDAYKLLSSATLFFYASNGMDCNKLFEELMLICQNQLRGPDTKSVLFLEQSVRALFPDQDYVSVDVTPVSPGKKKEEKSSSFARLMSSVRKMPPDVN